MKVNPKLVLHELDRTQIDWMKSGTLEHWIWKKLVHRQMTDKQLLDGLASCGIRVSETVMPELYHDLQKVCETLEIPEPLLYIENCTDDVGSYYTDGQAVLMINPNYLAIIPRHLMPTVLVRECGHIYCGHNEARSTITVFLQLLKMLSSKPIGVLAGPLEKMMMVAQSISHLTADRMAMIYNKGTKELFELCLREAGFYEDEIPEGYVEAFVAQMPPAEEKKLNDFAAQKALRDYELTDGKHPSYGRRIFEAKKWESSEDYQKSLNWFWEKDQAKEVKLFYSAKNLKGMSTDEVKTALEESSLTRIEFIENKGKQQDTVSGKVTSVSIDGKDDFEDDQWFPREASIKVYYDAR